MINTVIVIHLEKILIFGKPTINFYVLFCIAKSLITFWRAGGGTQTNQGERLRTADEK